MAAQVPDAPTQLENVPTITSANKIGLKWLAPVFNGGSELLDYSIWFDDASGTTFTKLFEGLPQLSYTVTSLTQGKTYQFKIKVRNAYGLSIFSNTVSILTAQEPAQPNQPTTVWSPDNVIILWTAPDNGGSPIIGYSITIKQSDSVYHSAELINCDMTSSTDTTCTIPVTSLRDSPFSLSWGTSIYAKVVATNVYGSSRVSNEGNGAIITTTPDSPLNLAEDTSRRTKSTLGLTWS